MEPVEIERLLRKFKSAAKEMAGYPLNQLFNYSKLSQFYKYHINNLGDPFVGGFYYRINTHEIERKVISRFAKLFHAPKDDFWGYVTTGGTEGNFYGLYVARELFPDGVVFYSDQTHYSIPKSLKILRMKSVEVKSQPNGEIDYQKLEDALRNAKTPPILLANIGTTMKGAIDDVVKIKAILKRLGIEKYYIHCDAAFFGMILPFYKEAECSHYDFQAGIDSIAISGHKMIGTPYPCGVVLTKKSNLKSIGSQIEYTNSTDNTITGSRNGLSPLFLWHELRSSREENLLKKVKRSVKLAAYAVEAFKKKGIEAWRNPNSIIVIFPKPSEKTIRKWQLAVQGDIAHIITIPHVSKKIIDVIVSSVAKDLKRAKKGKNPPKGSLLP